MKKPNSKGITLVALIITIVVLLILAVVAIGTLKDSDIIGYAKSAGSSYTIEQEKEQIGLALKEWTIKKVIPGNNPVFKTVIGEALNKQGNVGVDGDDNGPLTVKFNNTRNKYIVDSNGNIRIKIEGNEDGNEGEDEEEEIVGSISWIYIEMPISETETTLMLACIGDVNKLIIEEDEVVATKVLVDENENFTPTEETATIKISEADQIILSLSDTIKKVDFGNKLSGDITEKISWGNTIEEIRGLEGVTKLSCEFMGSLQYIELPSTLLEISEKCFNDCANLKQIDIPENVTVIGKSAFTKCINITSIDLSKCNLKALGDRSFNDCYALTELILPASLEDIGYQTFSACSNLTNITINKAENSLDLTYSGFTQEQIAAIKWVG